MDIVVLAGGLSTERDVSFKSGSMVTKALRENGHRVIHLQPAFDSGVCLFHLRKSYDCTPFRGGAWQGVRFMDDYSHRYIFLLADAKRFYHVGVSSKPLAYPCLYPVGGGFVRLYANDLAHLRNERDFWQKGEVYRYA